MNNRWLLVGFVLLIAGCAGTETDNPMAPEGVQFVRSKKEYLKSVSVDDQAREALQKGNLSFALDVYRQIAAAVSPEDNLFISPYSISTLMAMTYAGAAGATQSQMASALRFELESEAVHSAMSSLAQKLVRTGQDQAYSFEPFNSIWIQKDYPVQNQYLDVLSQYYDSGVYLADFESDPEQTRSNINEWIQNKTDGAIKDLFPAGSIDRLSRFALTNTVYFSGLWQFPFEESSTSDGKFTLRSEKQVTLPMMRREYWFPFAFELGWRAVALPYKNSDISMICVLPNQGEFDQFEGSLDSAALTTIVDSIPFSQGEDGDLLYLTIPKFNFDSQVDLVEPLSGLGMKDAFQEGVADFSAINDDQLFISYAAQKTHIAIDEKGTVAVAASGEIGTPAASSPSLRLDRPFIFLIWDNHTKTALFIGRLVHPEGPVSAPAEAVTPVSDTETICKILDGCKQRSMSKEGCLDALAQDEPAVLAACADCYQLNYDRCGGIPCFCSETICTEQCPTHLF